MDIKERTAQCLIVHRRMIDEGGKLARDASIGGLIVVEDHGELIVRRIEEKWPEGATLDDGSVLPGGSAVVESADLQMATLPYFLSLLGQGAA